MSLKTKMRFKSLSPFTLALCLLLAGACGGGEKQLTLRLTRGGAPLAETDVEVRPEHPPGGSLKRRTDAEGRVRIPSKYAGLRVMVGTDCDPKGTCKGFSRPHRLGGDEGTLDVEGVN